MNFRILGKYLGLLILFLGLNQLAPLICAALYREGIPALDFVLSMLVAAAVGGALYLGNYRTKEEVYRKEALAIVGLGWLIVAFFGALPFWFYGMSSGPGAGQFSAFYNCYFESMSGFTTTGATILEKIEIVPRGILFWRSYTHWLGGMGIIVLFVAVLPYLGAGGKQLFRSEVPGPVKDGLRPRIRESAMILWKIYLLFTVLETVALMCCKMSLFEALCHTFGTLATGGFSTRDASIAAYSNVWIHVVIIIFMYAAGVNFSLHFRLIKGDWKGLLNDTEWQWYTGFLLFVSILIAVIIHYYDRSLSAGEALCQGAFQAAAIQTTTGFVSADFDRWHHLLRILLVLMMFAGGCAGSTGGGMKVMRILLICKIGWQHLERVFSPRVVRKLRLGGGVIDPEIQVGVLSFFVLCLMIFVGSSLLLAALGYDLTTSLTAVIASLFNIGPGLGRVGAVQNYAFFDPFTKMWLSLLMVMGRLELYSILVLFVPSFWRSH